jgi:hypothetical protein
MLEFEMKTDLQKDLPQTIKFNFEELKADVAERLQHYNDLVVTEETIKEATEDKARLNKLKKALDERRKEVKKSYMQPYNDFEAKCKELIALVEKPVNAIDEQLTKFEDKRKEEKRKNIELAYTATIAEDLQPIIPLQRIFNERWLNKTYTMAQIVQDITNWHNRVRADMIALDAVEDEYRTAVRQKYTETLNITTAIAHRDALKAAEEAFRAKENERLAREEERRKQAEMRAQEEAERKAQQEAERQKAEAKKPEEPVTLKVDPQGPKVEYTIPQEPVKKEPNWNLCLKFAVTLKQAKDLRAYLDANKIPYEKVQ